MRRLLRGEISVLYVSGKVSKNDKLMMQEEEGRLLSVIIVVESKWDLAHKLLVVS